MKKLIITIALFVLLSGSDSLVYAQHRSDIIIAQNGQQRQGGGGRGGARPPQGLRPGEGGPDNPDMNRRMRMQDLKRLERLRLVKLLELLDLDSETESVVIPKLREHHKEMSQLSNIYQDKIDNLGKGLKEQKFSDSEILEKIREIDDLEMQRQEKIRAFHSKAGEILTAEQLGKLYVFQARFGGEVLEKMSHFRKAQNEFRKHESGN